MKASGMGGASTRRWFPISVQPVTTHIRQNWRAFSLPAAPISVWVATKTWKRRWKVKTPIHRLPGTVRGATCPISQGNLPWLLSPFTRCAGDATSSKGHLSVRLISTSMPLSWTAESAMNRMPQRTQRTSKMKFIRPLRGGTARIAISWKSNERMQHEFTIQDIFLTLSKRFTPHFLACVLAGQIQTETRC